MSVTTVWSADSALHDPAAEVWIGIRIDGSETPERGAAFRRAAVAAIETGRHYVGFDTQESYLELAEQRVAGASGLSRE